MKISDTRLQNFRRVLAEKKLRLTDIAEALGKAPAQVSAFGGKNPTKGIGDQIAREIEKALNLYHGYLDIPYGYGEHSDGSIISLTGRKLPVIPWEAVADWLSDNFDADVVKEWVDAPNQVSPRSFVFRMEGPSMEPNIGNGVKVVVDPAAAVEPGQFVIARRSSDNTMVLRKLIQEGATQYLQTLNPQWPNPYVPLLPEWTICGRARWVITDL